MKRLKKKIEILLCICLILSCNSVYYAYIPTLLFVFICIFLISLIILENPIIAKQSKLIVLYPLIFLYYFIPFFNITESHLSMRKQYFFLFCLILPLFIFYFYVAKRKTNLFCILSNLMAIISAYSSILWFLGSYLELLPINQKFFVFWDGGFICKSFYHIYFETQNNIFFGIPLVRNCAIFTEAPMFAFCLVSALGIYLFIEKKKNTIKLLSLLIGIVTTTSATAYIITSLMFIIQSKYTFKNILLKSLLFIGIAISGFWIMSSVLMDKVVNNDVSYSTRVNMLKDGYLKFIDNPIWGGGFYSYVESNSNSIALILSELGLYISLPILYVLLIRPIILYLKGEKSISLVYIFFFVSFCVTIIAYTPLALMYIAFIFNIKITLNGKNHMYNCYV